MAFEPDTRNFDILCKTTRHLAQIVPVYKAVSATSGEIDSFLSDGLNVDHQTYDGGEGPRRQRIGSTSLDDYVHLGTQVHFVKMDIQGAELGVLQGATRVLEENRDIELLFEYWP